MTLEEFREEMNLFWRWAEEEASTCKDPFIVVRRLVALHRKFDAAERQMADVVLAEWLSSHATNCDARWLIKEFKIMSAIPGLEKGRRNSRRWLVQSLRTSARRWSAPLPSWKPSVTAIEARSTRPRAREGGNGEPPAR